MAAKKRGLGRGLDALLSGVEPGAPGTEAAARALDGQLKTLPVDLIRRGPYQPRMAIQPEALEELAESIRAQGVVQPIVVKPKDGVYEIIAGERRWRAAQLAGLQDIPAVVRDVSEQAAMAMALIENIQREDLNPIEESVALKRLIEQFGLTHQEVAQAVGRSRAAVSNLLRLLELDDDVKRLLEKGDLEMGHARALLALQGAAQTDAARIVVAKGLSVRETESLVRKLTAPPAAATPASPQDPDVRRLQDELSERLGAAVHVRQSGKGKGKLVIHYNSLDELEGILAHVK
ncbi:MAG TPA: ParB/RepB/Spo0J family partition protein [Gammaproteobacteria bacterium]|nr:ParB/RepB/Spo0J family partition protein [Gammaproteobacteria bacterium]